jgi:hypothetical protein
MSPRELPDDRSFAPRAPNNPPPRSALFVAVAGRCGHPGPACRCPFDVSHRRLPPRMAGCRELPARGTVSNLNHVGKQAAVGVYSSAVGEGQAPSSLLGLAIRCTESGRSRGRAGSSGWGRARSVTAAAATCTPHARRRHEAVIAPGTPRRLGTTRVVHVGLVLRLQSGGVAVPLVTASIRRTHQPLIIPLAPVHAGFGADRPRSGSQLGSCVTN